MKKLKGSNAILTGASKGIGIHIAHALARNGVNLVLASRSENELEKVRKKVSSLGINAFTIPTDLTDANQVKNLSIEAEEKLGTVDILINNAGVEFTAPFNDNSTKDLETTVDVNLLAPMLLTQGVLPGMLKRGRGHIVNISSLAGKTGLPYQTPYSATKAGLIMFTHSLRAELADEPVSASVICPGFVSNDGMYARIEEIGLKAPKILKPTTTEKVVNAVIRVIKKDIAELVINPVPMRPGFILREIFPGITSFLHKIMGSTEFVRKVSEKQYRPMEE